MLKYSVPTFGKSAMARLRRGISFLPLGVLILLLSAMTCFAGTPYNGTPFAVNAIIPAVQYDLGGSGVGFFNPQTGQTNTFRPSDNINIQNPCPDTDGGMDINNTAPGEWFNYTVNVTTTGWYDFQIRFANPATGRFAHISIDGVNVTGSTPLINQNTGAWNVYQTQTFSGYNLTAGTHTLQFNLETPVGLVNLHELEIVPHVSTTYYVSPTGSDSNNGTSTATPWQTSAKVTATALNPGDTVLFQRGGVWREPLWPSTGGQQGLPITLGDYGSGNKPKFMGSVLLNNANFVSAGGNVYTYSIATAVRSVWKNQVFLTDNLNGRSTASTPMCWSWSSGVLTVNTGGGAPTGTWEAGTNYNVIANGNPLTYALHDHYVFNNLVSDESATNDNEGYGVRVMFGKDVTMNNIESYRCGKHSFGCIDATNVIFNNCYAAYPMPGQTTGYTAYVSYGDTVDNRFLAQASEYHNCVGEHMEDTWTGGGDGSYGVFTTHGATILSVYLDRMQSLSATSSSWDVQNGESNAAITIKGGLTQNGRLTIAGNNILIDGHTMTGPVSLIRLQGHNNTVQNCVITGSELSTVPDVRAAISVEGNSTLVRFNTIVMGPGTQSDTACINGAGGLTDCYGNICWAALTATNSVSPAEYNMYEAGSTNDVGTGAIITSSPLFTNPAAGDYSLQAGSPAINAALEPSSILSSIPVDVLGNNRLVGSHFDIGAYERQTAGSAPVVTVAAPVSASSAAPFTYQIFANNFPTSYGASGLPAGLSVNSSTGLITGTPSGSGTINATITATNSSGTGSNTLPITMYSTADYPFHANRMTIPGTIQAEDFDNGPINSAYFTPVISNFTNSYRSNTDIKLLTTNDGAGSYFVNNSAGGMWLNYMVNVTTSATYNLDMRTACGINGRSLALFVDGVNVTGFVAVTNSGFGTFGDTTFNGISLTAGNHTLQIQWNGDITDFNWFSLAIAGGSPPVVTSAASATGTVGTAFSYQITATNSPTSYGGSSLPAGTSVNTGTGLISGTPTTATTYNSTVTATNANGTGSKAVTITIASGAPAPPVVTSAATASGTVGSAFSYQITATNSPTSYGASSLPAGTSVNTGSGLISGTPTTAGTSNATVTATNAGGTGSKAVTITINAAGSYNVNAIYTSGTVYSTGGLDSFGNAYLSSDLGTTATFNGSTFTFGAANSPDGYANVTVPLSPGSYTTLNMVGTASGGIPTAQTFTVNYTDSTNQVFTVNMHDWTSASLFAGETIVTTMAHCTHNDGTTVTGNHYLHGYTLTLNGKSVASITLPTARGVVMLGFASGGAVAAPVINSALTASGTTGSAFSYNITATNSPTSYGATSLPAGLSVNTGTGAITGTPTVQGIYSIPISATNAGGTGSATLVATIGSPTTAFNVNAIYTTGTTFASNGGLDGFGIAYLSSQLGTSATYNTSSFTFGAANAVDGWSNVTVSLAPGTYTTLDMVGTASGGIATAQTFTVNYTDGTNQAFVVNMKDWTATSTLTGETKVVTMANAAKSDGTTPVGNHVLHGYTLTLNGKSVQSITLPTARGVVMLGFKGH